jgi:cytochrome P450
MYLRPPGPKPHLLIGNMPLAAREPLEVFSRWAMEYGDIFYYRAGWIHVYFLNHPDLIEYVLVRNPENFRKDRVVQNSRWFLGRGLLTNEGESWKKQRRLSQPAFHKERIASYAETMTSSAEQMVVNWQSGDRLDAHQEMMRVTLRIVVQALFGAEAVQTEKISRSLNVIMRNVSGVRMILPPLLRYLPLPGMMELRRAVDQLDGVVFDIIGQRRRKRQDSGDLLSMLLATQDEDGRGMNDTQLRDEVMTFLLAGHETTALALTWSWYLLSGHSEAEQRLHEELDRVLAGRVPIISDLPSLNYTEAVVKEALRLFPPAWTQARTAIHDFDLGGYRIPAGSDVVMSQWIMHRDERFFSDPDRFNPDRWNTNRSQNLPRFAYFPFGGGPRQCIGASFAMMEAILLLATIARRFRLRMLDGSHITPVPSLTLRPRQSILMEITARSTV